MEKLKRNSEYYKSIVSQMGTSIRSTDEMYRFINNTEVKFGGDIEKITPIRSSILDTLVRLLDKNVEITEDNEAKRIGRLQPRLFLLKSSVDETCKIIDEYYDHSNTIIENKTERLVSPKIIGKINLDSMNKGQDKPIERFDHVKVLQNILTTMMIKHVNEMSFKDLRNVVKTDLIISKSSITHIISSTEKDLNTSISYEFTGGGRAGYNLVFKNAKETMMIISKLVSAKNTAAKTDKEIKKPESVYIPVVKQKIEEKVPDTVREIDKSIDERDLLFIISGIMDKKANNLFDLCKTLRDKFKISVSNKQIIDIVKQEKEITVVQSQYLSFTSAESKEVLMRKYNPQNESMTIYARIGMSLEELQNFMPNAKLFSSISQCDNIYEITLNKSQHDFSKLLKLYQTFRGNDVIIGNHELVSKLNLQLKVKNGLWNGANDRYQLENEIEQLVH